MYFVLANPTYVCMFFFCRSLLILYFVFYLYYVFLLLPIWRIKPDYQRQKSIPFASLTTAHWSFGSQVSADRSECVTCQYPLTVKHAIRQRTHVNVLRYKYFVTFSINGKRRRRQNTVDFVKESHSVQRFFIFSYFFFLFYFGSCGRLSWLNCQLSSAR